MDSSQFSQVLFAVLTCSRQTARQLSSPKCTWFQLSASDSRFQMGTLQGRGRCSMTAGWLRKCLCMSTRIVTALLETEQPGTHRYSLFCSMAVPPLGLRRGHWYQKKKRSSTPVYCSILFSVWLLMLMPPTRRPERLGPQCPKVS